MKNTTNFAREFGLYESMFATESKASSLKESRTADEIRAEIARLQKELEQAEIAEKQATYSGALPQVVYMWDMYRRKKAKGTWTSVEIDNSGWDGIVFETEEDALHAGMRHLDELDYEDELAGRPEDYTIDIVAIPLANVPEEILEYSNLEHLI